MATYPIVGNDVRCSGKPRSLDIALSLPRHARGRSALPNRVGGRGRQVQGDKVTFRSWPGVKATDMGERMAGSEVITQLPGAATNRKV